MNLNDLWKKTFFFIILFVGSDSSVGGHPSSQLNSYDWWLATTDRVLACCQK
jgi:hypothetical protein